MAAQNIHVELQPIDVDLHRPFQRSAQKAVAFGQPLEFSEGRLAPFHDGARGEYALERFDDHRLALVHAERGDLHDENIAVFVHNQTAQKIALRIDHAKGSGPRQMALPLRQRGADAFGEKTAVDLHPLRRKRP